MFQGTISWEAALCGEADMKTLVDQLVTGYGKLKDGLNPMATDTHSFGRTKAKLGSLLGQETTPVSTVPSIKSGKFP